MWFKATLKKIYCVKRIERYTKSVHQKWNCTENVCNCASRNCGKGDGITVTVTVEYPAKSKSSSQPLFSDCKRGNVVKLEKGVESSMSILELVIIVRKPGEYFCGEKVNLEQQNRLFLSNLLIMAFW